MPSPTDRLSVLGTGKPEPDAVVTRILKMFADWGVSYDAMCRSFDSAFAADCVWENPGLPPTVGPRQAVELAVVPCRENWGVETIRVRVDHITHHDGLVWTERLDDLLTPDGTLVLSALVAGVMEIDGDGYIRSWREYSKRVSELRINGKSPV
jgi:limonene-1,2-epoxide hydrolase